MKDNFERIAGYEKEKEELKALAEIFINRDKYLLKGATLPKGIIFYGEAGTGKTLFSEVLTKECSLERINISLSDSASENNICRQIRKAFLKGARSKNPTMIFFDELDKLLPNEREEYYTDRAKSILSQLLTLIDGMEAINNIVFVATCNDYASLPESITRPGRFDKKIHLGLPNMQSRIAILHLYMDASPAKFKMTAESIAKLTSGFSCAALKTLVNECLLRSDEDNVVDEAIIRSKITEIKEEDIPTERSEQSCTIDAVRNVGSFIIARSYSSSDYTLTTDSCTVCNTFLDGLITGVSDCYDDDEDYYEEKEKNQDQIMYAYSKNDYLATITSLLGGYVAEEIIFGKIYNNLKDTLKTVDNLRIEMSGCGMLGLDLYYTDRYELTYSDIYIDKLNNAFTCLASDCYEKAKEKLTKNQELISRLTTELIKRKSIEKTDCEEIISAFGGIV